MDLTFVRTFLQTAHDRYDMFVIAQHWDPRISIIKDYIDASDSTINYPLGNLIRSIFGDTTRED